MSKPKDITGNYVAFICSTARKVVPFGTMLRAARLRFEYVERLDCFIRTSDKGAHFLVELRPNNVKLLNDGGKGKLYRDLSDPEKVIAMSPALKKITKIDKPVDLVLDDLGLETK